MTCACHDPAVWGHQPPCPAADTRPQVYKPANLPAFGNPWARIPGIDGSSR
jgi:hypothetical protein